MKIRAGFVSNSSSSSFLLFGCNIDFNDGYDEYAEFYQRIGITKERVNCGDEWWNIANDIYEVELPKGIKIIESEEGVLVGFGLVGHEFGFNDLSDAVLKEALNWREQFETLLPELAGKGSYGFGLLGNN